MQIRWLAVIGILLLNPVIGTAQNCGQILKYGLWENTVYTRATKNSDKFRHWWCNEETNQSNSSKDSAYDLGGQYYGIGGEFSSSENTANYSNFRQKACGNQAYDKRFAEDVSLFAQRASGAIVDAWTKCTVQGQGGGDEVRGVRAWASFPADPTRSRTVELNFRFRPPAVPITEGIVEIQELHNLSCVGLREEDKISVKDADNVAYTCQRGNDGEARVDFRVAGVPSNPSNLIFLHAIEREPIKTPFLAGLEAAVCTVSAANGGTWTKEQHKIIGVTDRERTDPTIYRCTWRLTDFSATRALFSVEGFVWDSGTQHDGQGGTHKITVLDQNSRNAGSQRWRKLKDNPSKVTLGEQRIAADFASPTRSISVEFNLGDSWASRAIRWTIRGPVLRVATDDQVYE